MNRNYDKRRCAQSAHAFEDDRPSYARLARHRQQDNKLGQLCRQVQRTVSLSLGGECHDEVLRELYVHSVVPAPDAGRLMVLVYFGNPRSAIPLPELLTRLDNVTSWLRREVAHAIVRKRAPELMFQLINVQEVDDV